MLIVDVVVACKVERLIDLTIPQETKTNPLEQEAEAD